ncbi:MAG TPA: hypothetical protein VHX86_05225 [Tepidisphaeraceae bacterium]|jgi:hypothetical protein|nr:hypothetical protein [Tepidisphaeraceae bacterium]
MKLINRLERRFGAYAIPNLTPYLILFQGFTFFISLTKPDYVMKLVLSHDQLFAGQWWRLLTLLIVPPPMHPVFIIFYLFIYYFIGTALEARWGAFRYDLYLLIGYVATVLVVLIPGAIVTNFYLMESVFLAFAWLYPDFEFLLFLILPVKVKWLALIGWAFYVWALLTGNWATKAEVAAGAINFLLFFHSDLIDGIRSSRRRFKGGMAHAQARDAKPPMHVCAECGVTDQSDKKMEFRYCPLCTGTPAYCINHINNHKHR